MKKYVRKGVVILRDEGVVALSIKSLQKIQKRKISNSANSDNKIKFVSLVDRSDVMKADWSNKPYEPKSSKKKLSNTINWVMSPPGGGGGHQNIFRFIEHLDSKGYKNNIYIYSTFDNMTLSQAKDNVKQYCKANDLSFYRYNGKMKDAGAVFATGWETAYPVFNDKSDAKKMYFVQDFEPLFYPMGTDYVLAENTYKFGFHGITAGKWLSDKLSKDYGMKCDYYDFSADTNVYKLENKNKRKEVFFYARPVTERRGFDLGIMALELFHKEMPEYTINLAGWDVSGYDIPFPYVNHKAMRIEELPKLYNKCSVALVMSLTNMSLLPLELLACGTIPVVNEGLNNRMVSNNSNIVYVEPSPAALASAMIETVRDENIIKKSINSSTSIGEHSWKDSCEKVELILKKELNNG